MRWWNKTDTQKGFTLLEVTIVLAVSSVLLMAAILTIGGRQGMTEFQQAAREVEHKMQGMASDVSAGLFSVPTDFACEVQGGEPRIADSGSSVDPGQCIFIGKIVQFTAADPKDRFYEAEVIARRLADTGGTVTNLDEAVPRTEESLFKPNRLLFGLEVRKMCYIPGGASGCVQNVGAVAFMSRLGSTDTARSSQIDIYPLVGTTLTSNNEEIRDALADIDPDLSTAQDPEMRFAVCFEGGAPGFRAVLTFGGTSPTPSLVISSASCEDEI